MKLSEKYPKTIAAARKTTVYLLLIAVSAVTAKYTVASALEPIITSQVEKQTCLASWSGVTIDTVQQADPDCVKFLD